MVQCFTLLVNPASARDLSLLLLLLGVPNYTNGNLHRNRLIICLLLCYLRGLAILQCHKHWRRPAACQEYCDESILVVTSSSVLSTVMVVCAGPCMYVYVCVCIYVYECVVMYVSVYMSIYLCRGMYMYIVIYVCIRQIYDKNCTVIR
jgi:hypothetical protein